MLFKKKIVAIIQARMGSTRFLGKMMIPLYGVPAIGRVIERVKLAKGIDEIIVATSTDRKNLPLILYCLNHLNIHVYEGSEDDVLLRVYTAAKLAKAKYIIDITGDCPLVDPRHITKMIDYIKDKKLDYVSNVIKRDWPDGFDVQVYTMRVLEKLVNIVPPGPHRSHVGWNATKYLYGDIKMEQYPLAGMFHYPDMGLTLDEPEDAELLDTIYRHFKTADFSAPGVIKYILNNKHLLKLNKNVKRKIPGDG